MRRTINMIKLFHADRENLIRYLDGELISFENGEGFIANELEAEKAIAELDAGREIILMVDNRPVSRFVNIDGKHKEIKLDIEEEIAGE
jgi:hypothetical protein